VSDIKAIETRYAGCNFRSRLEARWAVFFDHLGIKWEYEREGYVGVRGTPYLPDFWLPDAHSPRTHYETGLKGVTDFVPMWNGRAALGGRAPIGTMVDKGVHVEVKGSTAGLMADSDKIGQCIDYGTTDVARGLLILGPIPSIPQAWSYRAVHLGLSHHKGVGAHDVEFTGTSAALKWDGRVPFPAAAASYYGTEAIPTTCTVDAVVWSESFHILGEPQPRAASMPAKVFAAYAAARSARFEHGQSGAT